MGLNTPIEWCDHTWNWIRGCKKISPGCRGCYMFRDQRRYGRDPEVITRTADGTFNAPIARGKGGAWKWSDGGDVFSPSWSDPFLEEADPWRPDAWEIMRQRPGLRFFVLTKRPDLITPERLPEGWPLPNVLLGVSVENRDFLWRVRRLLEVPAVGRFVSAEPLLGSLTDGEVGAEALARLDWIIAGGESDAGTTPGARPSAPRWFADLAALAGEHDIPFHFKQWGEYAPADGNAHVVIEGQGLRYVGKKTAGRELAGRSYDERPRVGRTREYLLGKSPIGRFLA